MLTYNFRVCVLSLHTAVPKKNCSNLQVLWSPVTCSPCVFIRRTFVEKTSVPVPPKIGVGMIHIRPWLEVLGPLIRWKKNYRNWGHWLPNKSELWSRPNTRTNKFNTNEAIKVVIKDGCKIQLLFHWMVQLSWLLLGISMLVTSKSWVITPRTMVKYIHLVHWNCTRMDSMAITASPRTSYRKSINSRKDFRTVEARISAWWWLAFREIVW